jgi:hypothetical protein
VKRQARQAAGSERGLLSAGLVMIPGLGDVDGDGRRRFRCLGRLLHSACGIQEGAYDMPSTGGQQGREA